MADSPPVNGNTDWIDSEAEKYSLLSTNASPQKSGVDWVDAEAEKYSLTKIQPQMGVAPSGGIQQANVVSEPRPDVPDWETGYKEKYEQPGVPLDVHDEVGAWVGFVGNLYREKGDRTKYLIDVFGSQNVRIDEEGEPIIRVTDPKTGTKKDIWFNAEGLSVNDAMALAASAPAMAGAVAGIRTGKTASLIPKTIRELTKTKGVLRDVVTGSIGMEAAGAAQDVAMRASSQLPIRPGEIAATRSLNLPIDVALGAGLAGMGGVVKTGVNILGKLKSLRQGDIQIPGKLLERFRGDLQTGGLEAQKYIQDKTGVYWPLGPHETSGMPVLAQLWEYLRKYPSSAKVMQKFQDLKDTAEKLYQEFMIKPSTLEVDEVVGNEINNALSALKQRQAASLEQAAGTSEQAIATEIKKFGPKIATVKPQKDFVVAGTTAREKTVALRDIEEATQTEMRQNIAAMPGGSGKVFESGPIGLQDAASLNLKSLPTPEKTIKELAYDQYGGAIEVTRTGKVLEKEFVPDRVVNRLKSLAEEKKYSLSDLIQMRSDVYEDIAAGQAVPNTGTHYLNAIGKMLGESIDKGIELIQDPKLKAALKAANTHYKEKIIPFKASGISFMFPRVTEPGFVENTDIVKRLIGDSEKYNRWVKIVGKDSLAHQKMKRSVFDDLIRQSSDDLDNIESIDPKALLSNLRDLAKNPKTAGVYADVFGTKGSEIVNLARTMETVREIGAGKIKTQDVVKLFSDPKANIFQFENLIKQAERNAVLYKNGVMKQLVSGTFDPLKVNADEIVEKLIPAGSPSDVRQVWGMLSSVPGLQDQVTRKVIQGLFKRAERSLQPSDISQKVRGEGGFVVSAKGLSEAMGDAKNIQKLQTIIGKDNLELLKAGVDVKAVEDWAKAEGAGTGILTRGSAIGGLLRMVTEMNWNPIKITREVSHLIGIKLIATLISNKSLNKLTVSSYTPNEMPGLFRALVTSQPFIRAVIEDMPDDKSRYEILGAAKRMAAMMNQLEGGEPNERQEAQGQENLQVK